MVCKYKKGFYKIVMCLLIVLISFLLFDFELKRGKYMEALREFRL